MPSIERLDIMTAVSSLADADAMLEKLASQKARWVGVGIPRRIELLRQSAARLEAVAGEWAAAVCEVRALDPHGSSGSEPWLSELYPTMRYLRLLMQALEAGGQPRLPKISTRPGGQQVVRIFPGDRMDAVLFPGITADVWIEPGQPASQGQCYRDKALGNQNSGHVCLVLGAGNVGSIAPTNVLYKLFVQDQVVLLKTHPANAFLGPFWSAMLQPMADEGVCQMVHGGAELGRYLCEHPLVDMIHITGSDRTHDIIVWGEEPAQQTQRKAAGTPLNTRPISSELGCVTPIFVVPGNWSKRARPTRHVGSSRVWPTTPASIVSPPK